MTSVLQTNAQQCHEHMLCAVVAGCTVSNTGACLHMLLTSKASALPRSRCRACLHVCCNHNGAQEVEERRRTRSQTCHTSYFVMSPCSSAMVQPEGVLKREGAMVACRCRLIVRDCDQKLRNDLMGLMPRCMRRRAWSLQLSLRSKSGGCPAVYIESPAASDATEDMHLQSASVFIVKNVMCNGEAQACAAYMRWAADLDNRAAVAMVHADRARGALCCSVCIEHVAQIPALLCLLWSFLA